MESENLFKEFPPVSTREWKEKIVKDLKGADFEKRLIWHTDEGFSVQPFYRLEDVEQLPSIGPIPPSSSFAKEKQAQGNPWIINEYIPVKEIEEAAKKVKKALLNGAESITFDLDDTLVPDIETLHLLLNEVDLLKTPIHFKTNEPLLLINALSALADEQTLDRSVLKGSLFCDPVSQYSRKGHFAKSKAKDLLLAVDLLKATKEIPYFQTLTLDASLFSNAGATVVTEIAYALSLAIFYLDYLTENGFEVQHLFSKIRFNFAVGSNYFMEISKFRALRYLWAKVAESYGVAGQKAAMTLHATNSVWNKTIYDPYVNMLRTTTETMSAILGGVDEITVLPFDVANSFSGEMGRRVARNQQLILREESYLNKVRDIAAGSYYIENLTQKLMVEAWNVFLETENAGGYLQAFQKGFIQQRIHKESIKKDNDIAQGKRKILGVNLFPNPLEKIEHDLPDSLFAGKQREQVAIETLKPYRGAATLEAARYQSERINHETSAK